MSVQALENELMRDSIIPDGVMTLPNGKKVKLIDGKEAGNEFFEHLARLQEGKAIGYSTGFKKIDELTGGMKRGDFWVISGLSSMGKSAMALQIVLNAMKEGAHCLFFSMEMNVRSLMARAVSHKGQINLSQLTKEKRFLYEGLRFDNKTVHAESGENLYKHMLNTIKEIESLNPVFIDDPYLDLEDIRQTIINYNENVRKVDLVVPDYLQLIHSFDATSREREVANVSNAFKKLAVKEDLTVIAPVQLNEKQQVRESKVIEQDANVHIQIRADQKKLDKEGVKDPEGVSIIKNRDGEKTIDPLQIHLSGKYQTFIDQQDHSTTETNQ